MLLTYILIYILI